MPAPVPYDLFESHPHTLLSFFERNLILAGSIKNSGGYGQPERLAFLTHDESPKVLTGTGTREQSGRGCPIYGIVNVPYGQPGVLAYICDYAQGEICYQILSKKAKFCFTTNMNGCSFGIGSRTPTGDVLVTHCNARYKTVQEIKKDSKPFNNPGGDQQSKQRITIMNFFGPGRLSGILQNTDYRPNDLYQATVFGIRAGTHWQFYYQSYTRECMGDEFGTLKFTLKGVFPIQCQ